MKQAITIAKCRYTFNKCSGANLLIAVGLVIFEATFFKAEELQKSKMEIK